MKKMFTALAIGLVFTASIGLATETRVITMGGVGDFLIDDANIYNYPALVTDYPYNVLAELGGDYWGFPPPSLMVTLTNDKEQSWGVLGIVLNRSRFPGIVDTAIGRSGAPFTIEAPESRIQLIYGKRFGNLAIGLDFELAGDEFKIDKEEDTYDITESMGILGAKLGVKFGLAQGSWIDLALGIDRYSWSYEDFTRKYNDQGKVALGLRGRMIRPITPRFTLIPVLGFNMIDASWESEVNDVKDSEELREMNFNLGLGLNFVPYRDMKVIVGGIIGMDKYTHTPENTAEDKGEITTLNMPTLVLGVEAPIRNWLYGRVGMVASMSKTDITMTEQVGDRKETTVTIWDQPFDMFYGLGIVLGSFTLDAQVGADLLFEGPYLISGNPTNAMRVSLGYNFE